jgi:uncharacterized protein (TIGR03435 family)
MRSVPFSLVPQHPVSLFVRFAVGAALASICLGCLAQSQSQAPAPTQPSFEAASVRPVSHDYSGEELARGIGVTTVSPFGTNRFTASNITLQYLVAIAYGVKFDQLLGAPSWLNEQYYEITAKAEGDAGLTREQMQPLLQHLLEQRFHLVIHRETKEFKGYVLVAANGGPKLTKATGTQVAGISYAGGIDMKNGSLGDLALALGSATKTHVVDKTGIEGAYDFSLRYAPDGATDSPLPSLFTAIQEQFGLKLVPEKVPVEMLVIDHVDRAPTEN